MFDWLKSAGRRMEGLENEDLARRIENYINDACAGRTGYFVAIKVKESSHGKALLDSSPEQQIVVLYLTLKSYIKKHKKTMRGLGRTYTAMDSCQIDALQQLMIQLMRRNLPYQDQHVMALFQLANDSWKRFGWYRPHNALLGVLERTYKNQKIPDAIAREVERTIKAAHSVTYGSAEDRKLVERANRLIGKGTNLKFRGDFTWSRNIMKDLDALDDTFKHAWQGMLDHAQTAEASKPNKKWLTAAKEHIEKIGGEHYADTLNRWLTYIQQEKPDDLPLRNDLNATVMRGLIWGAILVPPKSVAINIKLMASFCFRKVKNEGAVSSKVGNACLHVLGQFPGLFSVSMLSELLQKIKYPSARRLVEKALDTAAESNRMTKDDLMEISVPDFGLDIHGQLYRKLGEVTAIVSIEAGMKVELRWQRLDGKTQKTIPASTKESHPDEVKALRKHLKDMRATLQAETARIEKLLLKPLPWPYAQWRERYLEHPLLRHITHKLIWQFENDAVKQSAMLIDGELQNHRGQGIGSNLEVDSGSFRVRLWHPVYVDPKEVLAWRNRVTQKEITQPFKQAHREVYLLTEAERITEQYSNRFAAHILKQHQLNALCQQRGWRYSLQGTFDSWNAPTLTLPQWDIAVELYLETVESSENEMGIYKYVSSDQVRFMRNNELLQLQQVEPVVFSEVMRDVDLFVGVCSIGNDPNWQDGGIHAGLDEYWREYAFGELLESAETRKEVLAKLLPKLKIANQCEIGGRFLKVRGIYRNYKIHLGSGNILMEPNDQYLCIVEGRGTNQVDSRNLILPFEGDHRMSVILSKAFLLAEDTKIKDKTILSQIKREG